MRRQSELNTRKPQYGIRFFEGSVLFPEGAVANPHDLATAFSLPQIFVRKINTAKYLYKYGFRFSLPSFYSNIDASARKSGQSVTGK